MLVTSRRRRGLARFGAVIASTSALAMTLTGTPANAAPGTASVSRASGAVSSAGVIPNGTYRWVSVNSITPSGGMCLAYDPGSRGAARQEGCFGSPPPNSDNTVRWNVVNTGGNTYEIVNQHNGQCLSIAGSSRADGAAAFVFTCSGTADQLFNLVPYIRTPEVPGLQEFQIVNVNSGKCVSVGGARTNAGAWVIQWTCGRGFEQVWRTAVGII
jgi:hypothetical protein